MLVNHSRVFQKRSVQIYSEKRSANAKTASLSDIDWITFFSRETRSGERKAVKPLPHTTNHSIQIRPISMTVKSLNIREDIAMTMIFIFIA